MVISRYFVKLAHRHEEIAAGTQEDAHVEQAAQDDDDAGRPPDARAVALLEQFPDGDHARITQRFHAEPP